MKQVLLIGYPFPLRKGGSPRLLGLAKYLPEYGWQPIILTAPLDEKTDHPFRIVETGYRDPIRFWRRLLKLNTDEDIRKQIKRKLGVNPRNSVMDFFLTRLGEIVNYPDLEKGWQAYAIKAGNELLHQEDVVAIISSSAPVTTHLIAGKLKLKHKIPWIADLRDLWTQNHNYSYSSLRKMIDRRLERRVLAGADALVTVSQPWADKLSVLHRGRASYTITNGFDPAEVNTTPTKLTDKFTITYTGAIYPGKQDPTKLLAALKSLISKGVFEPSNIEVRFYGPEESWLEKEIRQYGLADIVKQYGPVPRDIAIQKQRESQLLLLLDWDDLHEKGVYPGKVFEYLAARRPILATGGADHGVVKQLLAETKAGTHAPTTDVVRNRLEELYREYQEDGSVTFHGEDSEINQYSHRDMTRKFVEILSQLMQ